MWLKRKLAGSAAGDRGQPRPRVVPLWRCRTAIIGWLVVALAVLAGAGVWSWREGIPQQWAADAGDAVVRATVEAGFEVREIYVVGRDRTGRRDLFAAMGVRRGMPILGVDLEDARQRVVALPWVREARIERVLPDTLVLRIVERQPLAVWQHQGRFALIGHDGAVILRDNLGHYRDLPVVVGEDAARHASALLAMLNSQPMLMSLVEAAVRIGGRRWNVRLTDGIDVQLPEDDMARAWARLADYQRRHDVLRRDIRALDLRQPDRLIVRRARPLPAPPPRPGRST